MALVTRKGQQVGNLGVVENDTPDLTCPYTAPQADIPRGPAVRLLLFTLCAASAPAADWPQFLGPTRDGHSAETGLNWNWAKSAPTVAWTADVGSGHAGPVVAEGVVYLWHRVGDDDTLTAFAADTGKEKWKYTATVAGPDGPQAAPVVADGTAFVMGYGGKLHAVNVKSGEKVWVKDVRKEYAPPEGYFGVGAGLLVADGKVVVNVGAKGAGVMAFDATTGKEAWKATDDPPSYSTPTLADIGGTPHAVVFTRTGLVVLSVETGKVKYTVRHRSRIDASVNAATPLVSDGDVFATASYATGAALWTLGKTELEEVWANDTSLSCQYDTPVKVGDHLYGVHGRQDTGAADLVCVEWKSGTVKWAEKKFGVAHLLAVDGGLLALTEAGELVRFPASEKKYTEQSRAKVADGLTRAAPALANGRLYLRTENKLHSVNLK
jgi:outer membrane protein assembly factor BamB